MQPPSPSFDALIPAEMAAKAEASGVAKTHLPAAKTLVLGVLAGAFIALGAVFSTVATTNAGQILPYGAVKVLGGITFCLGLVLVVVAGAELFTGNNLIVMAWARRKISTVALLRNWGLVYVGNLVGSVATAALVFLSGHFKGGDAAIAKNAVTIAVAKTSLPFGEAIAKGVLCNVLVCLAVWLCMSARSTTDKVLAILFPITAFVAAGFEHCVANMYFIPAGLFIGQSNDPAYQGLLAGDVGTSLTWSEFIVGNLVPVTFGNILGGALLVGIVYWFIYLRPPQASGDDDDA